MDELTDRLLNRLEKSLDDATTLTRFALGILITFASADLAAHSLGNDYICGLFSPDGRAFTAVFAFAYAAWFVNLRLCREEQAAITHALEAHGPEVDGRRVLDPQVAVLLNAMPQFTKRHLLFAVRSGVVGGIMLILWAYVVDVVPGDWDPMCRCPKNAASGPISPAHCPKSFCPEPCSP